MAKNLFPLGKSGKSLQFSGGFDWCSIKFSALDRDFKVLIAVNFQKQQYYAYLGEVHGADTKLLMSYEYHSTHGGWHVHAGCGDTSLIPVGRYKGPWKRNIPKDWNNCRLLHWNLSNKESALNKACHRFNITLAGTQSEFEL